MLPQLADVRLQAGGVIGLGVAHGVEQEIGDLGHRRDHYGYRPMLLLLGGNAGRHPHTLGRPYTGAAEFHDEKLVQLVNPYPLVMRARTILRMASSTSSAERRVVSR